MLLMETCSSPTELIPVLYGQWRGHLMERVSPLVVEAVVLLVLIIQCESGRQNRTTLFACLPSYSTSLALARSCCVKYLLRKRIFCGVTSTSSSLLMKSSDCSRLMRIGGVKRTAISAVEERTFVFCFSLHTLTTISEGRTFSPTIIPS